MTEEKSTQHLSVFLSYARADKAFATQLKQILEEKGIKVWVDESELKPVEKWRDEIQHAILAHDFFVYVASRSSTAPESFCHEEIEFAKQNNKIIIPINIDPALKWLPNQIGDINWINFSAISILNDDETISLNIRSDEFDRSLDILLTALETDLDWVKIFTRLLQKGWEWEEHEKNDSYLLVGDGLQSFLEAVARYSDTKPELTPLQQAFLSASQAYDEQQNIKRKRNKKRLRALLISVSVLIVVACVSAFVIFRQTVNRIAGEISNVSGSDIETSLLLSLQAMNMSDSPDVRAAVHANLSEHNYLAKILQVGSAPQLAVGEDILVIGSCTSGTKAFEDLFRCAESEVQLLNMHSFDAIGSAIQIPGVVVSIIINETQDTFAVYAIEDDGTMVFVYTLSNNAIILINTFDINTWSVQFGPLENQIMIGTEGRIEFFDYKTGQMWRDPLYLTGSDKVTGIILDQENEQLFTIDRMGLLAWNLDEILDGIQPKPGSFSGFNHAMGVITYEQDDSQLIDPWLRIISGQDNQRLASRGREGIIIWDTQQRDNSDHLLIEDPIYQYSEMTTTGMAFLPETDYLIYTGDDQTVLIYDYSTKENVAAFYRPGVYDFNLSHDARYFIVSSFDGTIMIYDSWLSNKLMKNMLNFETQVQVFDYYLQDDYLLMTDGEQIRFYDLVDVSLIDTINIKGRRVALSPDRRQLAVSNGGEISVINLETEETFLKDSFLESGSILRLFYSPDGKSLYALSNRNLIIKINLEDAQIVWEYQLDVDADNWLYLSVLSPDGKYLVFPFDLVRENTVRLLDISGDKPLPDTLHDLFRKGSGSLGFFGFAFSPNSRLVALASETRIFIYDLRLNKVVNVIEREDRGLIAAVEFLTDDTLIISFSPGYTTQVQNRGYADYSQHRFELFSLPDNRLMGIINQPESNNVRDIHSLGGDRFISVSGPAIRVWDVSGSRIQSAICSIAGRDLTREEWEEYIGTIIPYQNVCSDFQEIGLKNDVDYFDPARTAIILGTGIDKKVTFYEDKVTGVKPSGRREIDFEIINQFNEISVEDPVMLQCRHNTNRDQYLDDFMIAWLINTGDEDYFYSIDAESFWSYPEGITEVIDLTGGADSGKTQVLIPEDMLLFRPQFLLNDIQKLHLQINAVEMDYFGGHILSNVEVEMVSGSAHANPFIQDFDYPAHSLRVNIDNQSGYDIDSVILFSLVYNQDGQVIDILIGGLGSHQNFPNGESRLVAARSHTITGRCVDFSSPYEPFTIRYYVTMFNYEHFQLGRWEGELYLD